MAGSKGRPRMAFDQGQAIVVGIGSYEIARWNVPVTVADAEGLVEALTDQSVAAYPENQVTYLHDQGATLEHVTGALDDLAKRVEPDDTVLISYAGHGVLGDDQQYYLTTHDTKFSPAGYALQGTGLSELVLLEKLRAIQAQKLLLIINACLSGNVKAALGELAEVGVSETLGTPPSPNLNVRVLGSGEGRAVITASRATQSSFYDRNDPSATFFGRAIIDALRGTGADEASEYVGLFDLYEYVYSTVKEDAAQIGGVQEPVLNIAEGVGPFPVALSARGPAALGGPRSIRQDLPAGTAAEVIERAVIEASRVYQPGMHVEGALFQAGRDVDVNKVIDFGNAQVGNVTFEGDVAGRDIVKVTISATPTTAAGVSGVDDLRALITSAQEDLEALSGATAGDREDVRDELTKANRAAVDGDTRRLLEKLDSARMLLMGLGPAVPVAVPLSETIAVLLQRARALSN